MYEPLNQTSPDSITFEYLQALFNPAQTCCGPFYNSEELAPLAYPGLFLIIELNEDESFTSLEQIIYVGVATDSIKDAIESNTQLKALSDFANRISRPDCHALGILYWINPLTSKDVLLELQRQIIKSLKPFGNSLK